MADRFFGLRHDAVVGRDHEHGDVGDVRPAGPHLGERFVARRIDERHVPAVLGRDQIGADVLRDAARFAGHDVGADDLVEQRRLAVIDVAQHGDDRRPRLELGRVFFLPSKRASSLSSSDCGRLELDLHAQLRGDQLDIFVGNRGVDIGHHPHAHQRLEHLAGADAGGLAERADRAGQLDRDLALARRGRAAVRLAAHERSCGGGRDHRPRRPCRAACLCGPCCGRPGPRPYRPDPGSSPPSPGRPRPLPGLRCRGQPAPMPGAATPLPALPPDSFCLRSRSTFSASACSGAARPLLLPLSTSVGSLRIGFCVGCFVRLGRRRRLLHLGHRGKTNARPAALGRPAWAPSSVFLAVRLAAWFSYRAP